VYAEFVSAAGTRPASLERGTGLASENVAQLLERGVLRDELGQAAIPERALSGSVPASVLSFDDCAASIPRLRYRQQAQIA